jgi:DNA topoisomerase-1
VGEIAELRVTNVLDALNEALGPHIFPAKADGSDPRLCPTCGTGKLSLKTGKFGAFIGCSNYPECRYTRPIAQNDENGDAADAGDRELGINPRTGQVVWLKNGRFGHYVEEAGGEGEKPRRSSLPKGWPPATIDIDKALRLLNLPREVGNHPEDGKPIVAGLGRYGPFVLHDGTYANLESIDEVFDVGLNRAVTVLAEKRAGGGRGQRAAASALKELGAHPEDGQPIKILSGRFGPYIKHGATNANVPRGKDPLDVTLEEAVALIAERASKGGGKKPAKKAAPKKAAAPKAEKKAPAAKAAGAKKPAAKKAPAKKKAPAE